MTTTPTTPAHAAEPEAGGAEGQTPAMLQEAIKQAKGFSVVLNHTPIMARKGLEIVEQVLSHFLPTSSRNDIYIDIIARNKPMLPADTAAPGRSGEREGRIPAPVSPRPPRGEDK